MFLRIGTVVAVFLLLCGHGNAFDVCVLKAENGTETGAITCEGDLICCENDNTKCCNKTKTPPPRAIPAPVRLKTLLPVETTPVMKDLPEKHPLADEGRDGSTVAPEPNAAKDGDGLRAFPAKKAKLSGLDSSWLSQLRSGKLPAVHELWRTSVDTAEGDPSA